ncbi:DMT family transporter [Anaerocolumna sp. MB42-C2]|uniref:DMT family transporter n=1 Tax=Anaerocolumna sp. MB42-C2 TaxID=3070997 RepID=UPI0027E01063|nr:DMT family transporter [Anaerocolumna sp. MB42-C2]WMJ87223.1 DMT family transporter [Anaerocolumna sp. MB42-C2]
MLIVSLILSFLAGVSIVLGRIINAQLAEQIGTKQSTLINYITGLSLSSIVYLVSNDKPIFSSVFRNIVPLWAYLGGLAGVVIIMASNYITPRLSAFYITLLIFIGQLFTGIMIDYFILKEVSIGKCMGGLLVFIGLTYNLWVDKKGPFNKSF